MIAMERSAGANRFGSAWVYSSRTARTRIGAVSRTRRSTVMADARSALDTTAVTRSRSASVRHVTCRRSLAERQDRASRTRAGWHTAIMLESRT